MGYCTSDNMLYGASGRSDTTSSVALNYPNTYIISGVIGDCDADGHFYTDSGTNTFTCIDVDPTRTTYLRALNPYTNFSEITTSPFTVSYTQATNRFDCNDWSYVPVVSGLVSPASGVNIMWILSLTTPRAYNVPVSGSATVFVGVSFADSKNFYIPTGSQIRKYAMSTTVANGSLLSASALSIGGDGAREVNAPVFYAQPIVKKIVSQRYGAKGDTLKFTVTIANTGLTTGLNAFLQDTVPAGLEFVPDSVFLDGAQQVGATPSFVDLGTLPIGKVFTVTFNALVTTDTIIAIENMANVNTDYFDKATDTTFNNTFASNITVTTLPIGEITSTKAVNKVLAGIGDTITYTIAAPNNGNVTALNVVFKDTIPNGTTLVPSSVFINGVLQSGANPSTGVTIPNIAPETTSTLTFSVVVTCL